MHTTEMPTGRSAPGSVRRPNRARRRVRHVLVAVAGGLVLSSCTIGCENGTPVVLCWKSDYETVHDPSGDLYYHSLTPFCYSLYGPDAGEIPDDAWPLHGIPLVNG